MHPDQAKARPVVPSSAAKQTSARKAYRGRLFRKYLLLILSLTTIVLLASSAISLYFSQQEIRAALADLQHEKAVGAASRIEQYVRQVSQRIYFASLQPSGDADIESRRVEFLRLLRQTPEVTDLAQLDSAGREQIAVSRLDMDVVGSARDRSSEAPFKNARRGQPWFGPVFFRKDSEPYMTVAMRPGGEKGPVTIADVNLKFIWDVISRIQIGEKGKAYVIDGTGLLVAHPDIDLVLRKTDLASLPHVKAAATTQAPPLQAMVSHDLLATPVLASVVPMKLLGWNVVVEQPIAEVHAKLDAAIWRAGWLLLASLPISALAAAGLARSMVRPIDTLAEGAQRIGEGDLKQQIVVKTGDELEDLAGRFNRMSAQLSESYQELERKVRQRTAELTRSLGYQTATAEILRIISSSPTDVRPVLQAIAERSALLCGADAARVWLPDGDHLRGAAEHRIQPGVSTGCPDVLRLSDRSTVVRAFVEGRSLHVEDVARAADPDGGSRTAQVQQAVGTLLAVPMGRGAAPVGAIALLRRQVQAFSGGEIQLVESFADQAVIAIENERLFHEIEDKGRQLEAANRHKSEFLANMSHELRTPLNAIIGFSEVLAEQMFGEVNDKQKEYLLDIHSSGQHLLTLINEVLDLSKIEAGRMELDLSCFDLGLLLDNALILVRERAQRQGLAISLDVGDGLTQWVADARKIKQVVVNLLSNAVKFTPAGGSVRLRARRVDCGAQVMAEVSVADTGVGIAPADQAMVFEAFRQASGDYLRKTEGTGLGLALAKRFVELHGGSIRVESRSGEGATFSFSLPQLDAEAAR